MDVKKSETVFIYLFIRNWREKTLKYYPKSFLLCWQSPTLVIGGLKFCANLFPRAVKSSAALDPGPLVNPNKPERQAQMFQTAQWKWERSGKSRVFLYLTPERMEEGGAWTVILTWGRRSFLTGREGETGRFCRDLQSNENRNTNCSFPETDHGRVELNERSECQDHPQVSVHPPVLQSPWKQRSSCQRGSVGGASPTRNFKRRLLRETSRWHHLPAFSSSPPHEPSSGIFSDSRVFSPI